MNLFPKHVSLKIEWPHLLIVFIFIFLVYFLSAPRSVVLEDDGIFILAAYFNGVAHPPGYPLFTLLGHFSTYLPFGSIAFRVHLLNIFLGTFTCVCLWWFCRMIMPGRLFAYTAAFAYGVSNIFWSQAIIAEVYVLNVLLFLLLLIPIINFNLKQYRSLLLITAFIYGLALSNHFPLIILSTPLLLCFIWPARRKLISYFPVTIPFILLGLLPYLWMVIRSQMDPAISFSGPINSFRDFLFTVSRENYTSIYTSPSAGWYDKLLFSGFIFRETMRQFGFIGFGFAIFGFLLQWKYWPRWLCIGLIFGYLGNTFFLLILLNFDYDFQHQVIFRVYPLIAYLVTVLWLALGVYITQLILNKYIQIARYRRFLPVCLFILVVGTAFAKNLPENYRVKDYWAEDYAKVVLESLEENAVLFTRGSFMTAQVGYLHLVNGVRPDVTLYDELGLIFSNRLFIANKIRSDEAENIIREFIDTVEKPVYYTDVDFPHNYGANDFGLYQQVDKKLSEKEIIIIAEPLINKYYESIIRSGEPIDPWEKIHYRKMAGEYCRILASIYELSEQKIEGQRRIYDVCLNYYGILAQIKVLIESDSKDFDFISNLLDVAISLKEQSITKSDSSIPEYYRGNIHLKESNIDAAIESFQQSIDIWPHPQNPAINQLQAILSEEKVSL